jgi:hypothetical protein
MNFTYEFTLKERPKVKMEIFLGTKSWRNFLEGLKRKIDIFIEIKNIFNPKFSNTKIVVQPSITKINTTIFTKTIIKRKRQHLDLPSLWTCVFLMSYFFFQNIICYIISTPIEGFSNYTIQNLLKPINGYVIDIKCHCWQSKDLHKNWKGIRWWWWLSCLYS